MGIPRAHGTATDTGGSTARYSHSPSSINGPSDAPSEDGPSTSSDSHIRSSTHIDSIGSSPSISVRRFLRSILSKGTDGLIYEFKEKKRVVGKDQSQSKFRLANESIWTTVWTEKADFIVHMGNESGSEAMRVGKVLDFDDFTVECIFCQTVTPIDFLKYQIVERKTGQRHEVAFINWKGRDPLCLRLLTILIDNLRLSGRAVLISSAKKEDGRAGTFALAAMAIEKLRGGDSVDGGLKPMLTTLDNQADLNVRQYVFVHRFILEYFKAQIDEKEITQFRSDHAAFHNATGNIFLYTYSKTQQDYDWDDKDVSFECKCFLWSKIPCIEKPIDGGPTTVTVIADFSIENSELVVECAGRGDCMDADYIPLKKIISKLDELGRDVILIVMGEGPAEFDLANLATSRVAVVAAMKKEEEEATERDDDEEEKPKIYDFNRMKITIMKILESFSNHREAIECIQTEKELRKDKKMWRKHGDILNSATFKADLHVDWMTRRDESIITQVEYSQEDQSPITPSRSDFRKLLESIQSTDSEQRLDAESKWRRIPGEEKKDLLLKMCKSKEEKVRLLAFERLNMLLNCIAFHWGEKKLTQFAKEIIAAAIAEKSSMVGRKIAEVLALVADVRGVYERTECEILKFVLGRKRSDGTVVKIIALEVAAAVPSVGVHNCSGCGKMREWENEYTEFFENMIDDESVRSKAIEQWTKCLCDRYYQREEFSFMIYEFGDVIQKIIKMCEGNRSTEKGAPLWALIKVVPYVELHQDRCDEDSFETAARCLIEAASKESDEEALQPIVEAIKFVLWYSIWPDVVKLIHRCCSTNNKSLKNAALEILVLVDIGDRTEDEFFDFGDSLAITLIESIKKCFWEVPKRTRYRSFLNVASRFEDKPPMECIDRMFLMCIQAEMKDKEELGFLLSLSYDIPKLIQRHFDAVMDAFKEHSNPISYRCWLTDIMRAVPTKLKDPNILKKYVNDTNQDIRSAALRACEEVIENNKESDNILEQFSFYVTQLIQNTHENPTEEKNGDLYVLFGAVQSLPQSMLVPHAEEILKIAIEQVHSLNWETMGKAVSTFTFLLSSMGTKGGVDAIRSLWVVQWSALKRVIKENSQKELVPVVIKSITECLLLVGKEGLTDEMKEMINNQLDEVLTRAVELDCEEEDRDPWSSRHETTQLCAVTIASNLIQLDPDFAFHHQQSITHLLLESLAHNYSKRQGQAVAAFGIMAESNHTEWAAVAVAALEQLCSLVARENNWYCPIGIHTNPIWAVMRIVKHCGSAIDSEQIRLILGSFLSWLPHLKDKKEGHRVYGFVADLIEAHNETLLGELNEIGTKLLTTLVKVIKGDLFFSSEEGQAVKMRLLSIVEKIDESSQYSKVLTEWKREEEEEKDSASSSTSEE